MSARRLRWRGVSQQRAILAEMQRLLGLWLKVWSVDTELLALSPTDAASEMAFDRQWTRLRGRNGIAWVAVAPTALGQLGGLLAGASGSDGIELGSRVGERALRALLTQWVGTSGVDASAFDDSAPASVDLQQRFGGMRFTLEGGGFSAIVVVDGALCDQLAPTTPPAMPALDSRASALGAEAVELCVTIDLGEASLADTHGLQVGDVLVSKAPLDSKFQLTRPDLRPIAAGWMHRHGDRRALRIDVAEIARKSP